MALYLIGLGLGAEKDVSVKGLKAIQKCSVVYLERYTSVLGCPISKLEELYKKKIILADRTLVEKAAHKILRQAEDKDVVFLVVGDALTATTHTDLFLRAKQRGIQVKVIHNASILTAIAVTGLQLYRFGKTTSVPFKEKNFFPVTPYETLVMNKKNNLHTLLLLDLHPAEKKHLSIQTAVSYLLEHEEVQKQGVFTRETFCVGCVKLGHDDEQIIAGTAEALLKKKIEDGVQCLIVPATLHFMEEEFIKQFELNQ